MQARLPDAASIRRARRSQARAETLQMISRFEKEHVDSLYSRENFAQFQSDEEPEEDFGQVLSPQGSRLPSGRQGGQEAPGRDPEADLKLFKSVQEEQEMEDVCTDFYLEPPSEPARTKLEDIIEGVRYDRMLRELQKDQRVRAFTGQSTRELYSFTPEEQRQFDERVRAALKETITLPVESLPPPKTASASGTRRGERAAFSSTFPAAPPTLPRAVYGSGKIQPTDTSLAFERAARAEKARLASGLPRLRQPTTAGRSRVKKSSTLEPFLLFTHVTEGDHEKLSEEARRTAIVPPPPAEQAALRCPELASIAQGVPHYGSLPLGGYLRVSPKDRISPPPEPRRHAGESLATLRKNRRCETAFDAIVLQEKMDAESARMARSALVRQQDLQALETVRARCPKVSDVRKGNIQPRDILALNKAVAAMNAQGALIKGYDYLFE